ncbi:MAG: glycosyltransferase family 2 protein [Bacteroidia bacterium]|nr:glycosyltransferase family 2 protein [Bacteroidia bacterium]
MAVIHLLVLLVFSACLFTVAYTLFFSVAGHLYRKHDFSNKEIYKKIAVLIPAYREDEIILQNSRHALLQNYPSHFFDLYVIADSLKEETLRELRKLPLKVITVSFEVSTKARALHEAFKSIPNSYDLAVILDADHLMQPGFLDKINRAAVSGCYAIQGRRMTRTRDSRNAVLEGISDEVNNHILRKGQACAGLSASITGSGMAFSFLYLRQVMSEIEASGGFEKELEMTLVDDNHKVVYLDDAVVLDEKVYKPDTFTHRHTRFLASQLLNLKKYFLRGVYHLFTGRIDYANKVMQFALIPKVFLLGTLLGMFILSLLFNELAPGPLVWALLAFVYLVSYAMAIPAAYWNRKLLMAMLNIPRKALHQIRDGLGIKSPNGKLIDASPDRQFEKTTA